MKGGNMQSKLSNRLCKHEGCGRQVPHRRAAKYQYECDTCDTLRRRYGITNPERQAILDNQQGECAICESSIHFTGKAGFGKHNAHLDHCHTTVSYTHLTLPTIYPV